MTILFDARSLVNDFPNVREVDGASFEVSRGSCFGLLGPNGAVKTTTLEMLESISRPTSGEVLYKGRAPNRGFQEEMGIQFQSTALQDFQTVGVVTIQGAMITCAHQTKGSSTQGNRIKPG